MSYPKKVLTISPLRGVNLDVSPSEAGPDFYSEGSNFLFRENFPQYIGGARVAYSNSMLAAENDMIVHAINTQISDQNYWIVISLDGTSRLILSNSSEVIDNGILAPVEKPSDISSDLINGVPVINSPFSVPVYWPGAGNFLPLPGWDENNRARKIVVFKYHIFALDIIINSQSFPNLLQWSSAAEPGTIPQNWIPDSSNDAGSTELSDGAGGLLTAIPLRDTLVIYKKSTAYACQFVGGNAVFAFKKVDASHGALNRNSVCDIGDKHFIVEQNDIVLSDGTTRRSLGHNRIKKYLFNTMPPSQYEKLFVIYNRIFNEVLIAFAEAGQETCNKALIYHIDSDTFSPPRDLPLDNQLQSNVSGATHAVVGFVDDQEIPLVYEDVDDFYDDYDEYYQTELVIEKESLVIVGHNFLEVQDSDTEPEFLNGPFFIRMLDLDFGDPRRFKFVKSVRVYLSDALPEFDLPRILLGSRDKLTESIDWTSENVFDPEQGDIVNIFKMGRYISIEYRHTSAAIDVKINRIEIEAELRGYY